MPVNLIPQPKKLTAIPGRFDFRKVDQVYVTKGASARTKFTARLLAAELSERLSSRFTLATSAAVKSPHACLITSKLRKGIFLPAGVTVPQGYELVAAGHSLTIDAADEAGFFYATRTVLQLLEDGPLIPALKITDYPVVTWRCLHFDLKGLNPNFEALRQAIDRAASYKLNAVLLEYEDRFPHEATPEVRGPGCLSLNEVKELVKYAGERCLEIVPLVQTLGHLEYLLRYEKYADLREVADEPGTVCCASPQTVRLLKRLVDELAAVHPGPRIHIGADEAFQLGRHPQTAALITKLKGKVPVFLEHVTKIVRHIQTHQKQALLWDDMLRDLEDPLLLEKKLPQKTGLGYWDYQPQGGIFAPEKLPLISTYSELGFPVYGACAVRGADGVFANVPHYATRMNNVDLWTQAAESTGRLAGLIATGWAKYNSLTPRCDPWPVMWPSALYFAERTWAGMSTSRESFEARLLARFYGLPPEATAVIKAHYDISSGRSAQAVEVLAQARHNAKRGQDVLEALQLLAALEDAISRRKSLSESFLHYFPTIVQKTAPKSETKKLRENLVALAEDTQRLRKDILRAFGKQLDKDEIQQFLHERFQLLEAMLEFALGYV